MANTHDLGVWKPVYSKLPFRLQIHLSIQNAIKKVCFNKGNLYISIKEEYEHTIDVF